MRDSKEIEKVLGTYPAQRYADCLADWDWHKHDVFDESIRPKDKVIVRDERWEDGRFIPAELADMEVNRLAYPFEVDIVNKHTAFTVGREPRLVCEPSTPTERAMLEALEQVGHNNKLKYVNKREVRSWLSETMVGEYWWMDEGELKVKVWSPFRGDKIIPVNDEHDKLSEVYRFYTTRDDKGNEVENVTAIDIAKVETYRKDGSEWTLVQEFAHGFNKIPFIYMTRPTPLCDNIRTFRNRLEMVLSNSADCNDYHYAPKQVVTGDISVANPNPKGRGKTIKLENGASIEYLTWQQSPEVMQTEVKILTDAIYAITNTPQMTPEAISSTGATSGEAFKYVFAGINIAVQEHEEVVGEFLQRRINFLLHALAVSQPKLKDAEGMTIQPVLQPYVVAEEEPTESKHPEEKQ